MSKLPRISSSIEGWARPVLILLPYIFLTGIFQKVSFILLGFEINYSNLNSTPSQDLIIASFTFVGTIVVVFIFRNFVDKKSFISIGFYPDNISKNIFFGILLGALIITTTVIILTYIADIKWVGVELDFSNLAIYFLLFLVVGLGEEIFFRGYILNNLLLSMHRIFALIVSSIYFSLWHLPNEDFSFIAFINITFSGVLLGISYIYTKNLWMPIGLHLGWNFFQGSIFGFNVSGHHVYSLFRQSRISNTIWNGGVFGLEGSALLFVIQLIFIVGLLVYFNKNLKSQLSRVVCK